jgi:VWFA-related protein
MHLRNSTLALLLALSAVPVAAHAQPTPTLKVYSRETLVDVTVTDAQGHPVHGLTQSDFAITEDGAPQSIRSFQEFSARTATAARTLPKLPPNVYSNLQPSAPGSAVNILLLDFVDTSPGANPLSTRLSLQDAIGIQRQNNPYLFRDTLMKLIDAPTLEYKKLTAA